MTIKLIYITTVPISLGFLHGHVGYLESQGFEIQVISSPGEALDAFGRAEAVPAHAVKMERRISPLRDLTSLPHLWQKLRALKPDLVHALTPKAGLLGTLAARLAGVPAVVLSINGLPQMIQPGLLRTLLNGTTRLSCRLADLVWCDSFSLREHVERAGLCSPQKLTVLGHGSVRGVDARHAFSPDQYGPLARQEIRHRHGIPMDSRVLGYVGRLVADKGMHELAEAWRSLRDRHPDLHLLLIGAAEAVDPMPAEDEHLFRSDPRVHLAGQRRDVAAYFAAMDVNVMPSYRESFGIANIEAAAMAVPVVSTRIPGCVDSVQDGVTGTLVPPRDAPALTAAIRHYLDDPHLRAAHGRAGRVRVLRDFRPESLFEALHQQYVRLLTAKGLWTRTDRDGEVLLPLKTHQERRAA